MARKPAPELPYRFGLPLALLLAVGLVAAARWLDDMPYRAELWYLAFLGAPFLVLALGKVRDWVAWTAGVVLTGAVLGYQAYDVGLNRGVNIPLGVAFLLSPFVIAGLCLAIAGTRGRVAWAMEGDEAPGSR